MDYGTHQASEVDGKTGTKSRRMRVGFLKSIFYCFWLAGRTCFLAALRLPIRPAAYVSRSFFGIPMPRETARRFVRNRAALLQAA
jgi:hypothetical protein